MCRVTAGGRPMAEEMKARDGIVQAGGRGVASAAECTNGQMNSKVARKLSSAAQNKPKAGQASQRSDRPVLSCQRWLCKRRPLPSAACQLLLLCVTVLRACSADQSAGGGVECDDGQPGAGQWTSTRRSASPDWRRPSSSLPRSLYLCVVLPPCSWSLCSATCTYRTARTSCLLRSSLCSPQAAFTPCCVRATPPRGTPPTGCAHSLQPATS